MRTVHLFSILLALTLMAGLLAASPIMQIQNYTTTPDPVYAGTIGYLQVRLNNAGDATASAVSAVYMVGGVQGSVSLGDVASGSVVPVNVPFKIDASSAGGIQIVQVDIYYYDQSSSASTTTTTSTNVVSKSKVVSLQVPLLVAQPNPLDVRTLSLSDTSIGPGDSFSARLALSNTGGQVNNLAITLPANSSFSLDGISQEVVGTIPVNSTQNVSLALVSSSSTPAGTYSVPVVFTYYDRLNRPNSITLSIGPVNVQGTSTQYRLQAQVPDTVEIGSPATLHLTLTNTGTRPISASVSLNSTDIFTPLGSQMVYFDTVAPGASTGKDVVIGVSASASAGYYSLPVTISPSSGGSYVQSFGMAVKATPQLSISLDQTGTPAQITIANTGNSQVRSVDVSVSSKSTAQAAPIESFVGTLNVDDYSTVTLASGASGVLDVTVRFRDSNNAQHSITQELDAATGAFSGNFSSGSAFSRNGTGARGAGGGMLGGLLGGGARPGTAASAGINPILLIAGAVVVLVAAFLLWRHFKGKKKKEAA